MFNLVFIRMFIRMSVVKEAIVLFVETQGLLLAS